jgi:hypothetical protein
LLRTYAAALSAELQRDEEFIEQSIDLLPQPDWREAYFALRVQARIIALAIDICLPAPEPPADDQPPPSSSRPADASSVRPADA